MKTKRKSTRRTRKQRGGVGDEEIVDLLHDIMITRKMIDFRELVKTFYEVYEIKNKKDKLTRDKWISILKQLFQKNGIKLTFHDHRDAAVSTAVLSYYDRQERCPGPGCVDPEPGHMYPEARMKDLSPDELLKGYLETAYTNLEGIVKQKIRNQEPLFFSVIRAELLKKTRGIRRLNADFVTNDRQWVYLLIRLRNNEGIKIILDGDLPPFIEDEVPLYYAKMEHEYSDKKQTMVEEESRSRTEALRMPSLGIADRRRMPSLGMEAEDTYRIGVTPPWDERNRNAGQENNWEALKRNARI